MNVEDYQTVWLVLTRSSGAKFAERASAVERMKSLRERGVASRLYKVAPVLEATMRPRAKAGNAEGGRRMREPRFGTWTPTSERLPSGIGRKNKVVLAAWNGGEVSEASVFKIGDRTIWIRGIATFDPPTHWMPMPPPPDGDAALPSPPHAVGRPPHYAAMSLQPFDAARAWGLGLSLGSAVKYVARHLLKGDPVGDLNKAKACIDDEIAWLERSGRLAADAAAIDDER